MALILDGSSERGAHVRSKIGKLVNLGDLFTSAKVANLKFISIKTFFYTIAQHVLVYHLI